MQISVTPARNLRVPTEDGEVVRPAANLIAEDTIKQANRITGGDPVLRKLLSTWIAADCDYHKWYWTNRRAARLLEAEAARFTLMFGAIRNGGHCAILSNHPHLNVPARRVVPNTYYAYQAFAAFLLCAAPHFDVKVCDRCQMFYWNRWGHTNKRFCGRQCSRRETAKVGQAKRHSALVAEKNGRIQKALEQVSQMRRVPADWKRAVVAKAGPDVTVKYVTRVINQQLAGKPNGIRVPESLLASK